jgi:hypothetical protein
VPIEVARAAAIVTPGTQAHRRLRGTTVGKTRTLLRELGDHEDLPSIAAKIGAIDQVDWVWVEVLFGVPFRSVPSGGLSASEVWQRACAPWLRWVR